MAKTRKRLLLSSKKNKARKTKEGILSASAETTNYEEFRDKYPQGSKGAQLFERFTSKFELAGILIEYGSLDENLYFDRYGDVQIEWEMSKSVIYGIRKEWNYPRFRENFELLATRGRKWSESHVPKIKEHQL